MFNIHTRGNITMRNIYTSMALGSYGSVLKLAITRRSYGKTRQKIKMQ